MIILFSLLTIYIFPKIPIINFPQKNSILDFIKFFPINCPDLFKKIFNFTENCPNFSSDFIRFFQKIVQMFPVNCPQIFKIFRRKLSEVFKNNYVHILPPTINARLSEKFFDSCLKNAGIFHKCTWICGRGGTCTPSHQICLCVLCMRDCRSQVWHLSRIGNSLFNIVLQS